MFLYHLPRINLLYTVNTFYCESYSYTISIVFFKKVSGMRLCPELEVDKLKMWRATGKTSWIQHLGCFLTPMERSRQERNNLGMASRIAICSVNKQIQIKINISSQVWRTAEDLSRCKGRWEALQWDKEEGWRCLLLKGNRWTMFSLIRRDILGLWCKQT